MWSVLISRLKSFHSRIKLSLWFASLFIIQDRVINWFVHYTFAEKKTGGILGRWHRTYFPFAVTLDYECAHAYAMRLNRDGGEPFRAENAGDDELRLAWELQALDWIIELSFRVINRVQLLVFFKKVQLLVVWKFTEYKHLHNWLSALDTVFGEVARCGWLLSNYADTLQTNLLPRIASEFMRSE